MGANKQAMTGVELTAFRRGGETRLEACADGSAPAR